MKEVPILARFFAKTTIPADQNACWGWNAAKANYGYGLLGQGKRLIRAHRFSYEFFVGPIPNGHDVLHMCDNPPCCNPKHLFTGTATDNMRDCSSKGRIVLPDCRGESNLSAKLTINNVHEVRKLLGEGWTQRRIAQRFGVTQALISEIKRGRIWSDA